MSSLTPAQEAEMRRLASLAKHRGMQYVGFDPAAIIELLDDLAAARGAIRRLIDQPMMHPLSMTPEQRAELWAAHAEARARLDGGRARKEG